MNDIKIAGVGTIIEGEYNIIKVSGAATIKGDIKAAEVHSAGSLKSYGAVDIEKLKVAGSVSFFENYQGGSVNISGSALFEKKVKLDFLSCSGSLKTLQLLEAESLEITGYCNLMEVNVDRIKLQSKAFKIEELHADNLLIEVKGFGFKTLFGKIGGYINICECTTISADNLICNKLYVKDGVIGPKCEIEYLEYSGTIDIHVDAKVKNLVKATL